MDVSGSYKIPTVRLRTLYLSLEELFKVYNEKEFTKEEFRTTLKINPKSSGILQKILDFKAFGLLEETDNKLRITNAGQKLLQAEEKERLVELQKIVKNVELWKILFEQYHTNIDSSNFWNILSRVTQLDPDSAKSKSEKVLKAYFDDINFALTGNAPQSHNTITHPRKTKIRQTNLLPTSYVVKSNSGKHNVPNLGYSLYSDYGDFSITINDGLTFNIAKIAFDEIFKAMKTELIKNGVIFPNDPSDIAPK